MTTKKTFTDLEFRGMKWYLAEEVDKKLEDIKKAASRYHPPKGGFNIFGEILGLLEASEK